MSFRDDCRVLDEISEEDRKSLKNMLSMTPMKRLIGTMVRELEGKRAQIGACDLGTDEGVKSAIKLQGEISGQARVLDLMLEGFET